MAEVQAERGERFVAGKAKSLVVLAAALIAGAGCRKSAIPSVTPHDDGVPSPFITDVCSLVTKDQVSKVQGTEVGQTTPTNGLGGDFAVSQCFYHAAVPEQSVTLALIQRDPKRKEKRSVRKYWQETFAPARASPSEEKEEKTAVGEKEEEEAEKGKSAVKVEGVGEEAFWTTNPAGGVLYVFQQDKIIRVSIGGRDDLKTKLEKSTKLAREAVRALAP